MDELRIPRLTVEDAKARIIAWLLDPNRDPNAAVREPIARRVSLQPVIDVLMKTEAQRYREEKGVRGMWQYRIEYGVGAEPFHEAAWDLAMRGVLMPAPATYAGAGPIAALGWEFVVTEYGRQWLDSARRDAIPTDSSRFAELLSSHAPRFTAAFHARAQEAVRCYQAHTHLACCVMCGAAAEAILLSLAFAKKGDEDAVLRIYHGRSGRREVEKLLFAQANQTIRESAAMYTELLKYWRDSAAHGDEAPLGEEQSFIALLLLLNFARFAESEWSALTQPSSPPRTATS